MLRWPSRFRSRTFGGKRLFESEPNNGVGGGVFQVTAGVDVIIRVRGQKKSTGDYAIQLNFSGQTPASSTPLSESGLPPTSGSIASTVQLEVEKDDTKATANKVDFSWNAAVQGAANGKRDNGFFRSQADSQRNGEVEPQRSRWPREAFDRRFLGSEAL